MNTRVSLVHAINFKPDEKSGLLLAVIRPDTVTFITSDGDPANELAVGDTLLISTNLGYRLNIKVESL